MAVTSPKSRKWQYCVSIGLDEYGRITMNREDGGLRSWGATSLVMFLRIYEFTN